MDILQTHIGQMLEQVKMAMLAHTPVVFIPTDQMEVIQELLYGKETIDAIVPRVTYKAGIGEVGRLTPSELVHVEPDGRFSSIQDNIKIGVTDPDSLRVPSIVVAYTHNKDWTDILSNVRTFIQAYLGVKKSNNHDNPEHADIVRRSIFLVVSAVSDLIPAEVAPYVKTVRVPALSDEEIMSIIESHIRKESISTDVLSEQLLSQMIVSFRGFSAYRIEQMLNQMVAQESIDYDYADASSILDTIRFSKKQLLENSQGLRWESTKISGAAGLDAITQWLKCRTVIFQDTERAIRQHMDIPKGLLVSGIPGSGKSLLAKTAASILEMPLVSLDMGALLGGLMGESEHNMIRALAMAEQMAPCVLWIDEIEKAFSGSFQSSSGSDGGVGRRMFGKFLTWMQEKTAACFVFATSNDITCLPPELFRSERFDRKFFTFMPMADECAQIFAANIKKQNDDYKKELSALSSEARLLQAQSIFSQELEQPAFWLSILNDCCCPESGECQLVPAADDSAKLVWASHSRPRNKLLTGADIASLIREAKFDIHPSPIKDGEIPFVIYDSAQMAYAVRSKMTSAGFKPYGETNLKDIVKCFLKLHENEFVPASGQCILDFTCYNDDSGVYEASQDSAAQFSNRYDRILYCTLVGAINHYSLNKLTR